MAEIKINKTAAAGVETPLTDKVSIFVDSADDKLKYKNENGNIGVVASEEEVDSKISIASDAEVKAWTNTDKFITPKTLADNYTMVSSNQIFTRNTYSANWAVTYAHWLWKIPKLIMFHASTNPSQYAYWSNGSYAWWVNRCLYRWVSNYEVWSSNTYSMMYVYNTTSNMVWWAVTAVDETNVTITRTKTWSPSDSFVLNVLMTCFA